MKASSLFIVFYLFQITPLIAQDIPKGILPTEDVIEEKFLAKKLPAQLKIKVVNSDNQDLSKIEISYALLRLREDSQIKKYGKIDSKGECTIMLTQNLPYQQVFVSVGKLLYTVAYVNSNVTIVIDAKKIKNKEVFLIGNGIEFLGTDGELNTVMNKSILFKKDEKEHALSLISTLSRDKQKYDDTAFLRKMDSLYSKVEEVDNEFIAINPKYAWAIKNETLSHYYGLLCVAYWGSTMPESLLTKVNKHKPFFISNEGVGFYNYLFTYNSLLERNRSTEYNTATFRNYSKFDSKDAAILDSIDYFNNKGVQNLQPNEIKRNYLLFNDIATRYVDTLLSIKTKRIIGYLDANYAKPKSDILKLMIGNIGKDNLVLTYGETLKTITTYWCRLMMQDQYDIAVVQQKKIDELLSKEKRLENKSSYIGKPVGELPFGAKLYTLDSIEADQFIFNLKSNFNKKAIIIDFWATWCGPCIADFPYSKKLHEQTIENPIEYVYICTNRSSNEKLWKQRIAKEQLSGTHIFVEDKMVTAIKTLFLATEGFPSYALIDLNGVHKGNAIQRMQFLEKEQLLKIIGYK